LGSNVKYLNESSVRVYNTPTTDPNTASVYDRTKNPMGSQQSSVLAPTGSTPMASPFMQQQPQQQVYTPQVPVVNMPQIEQPLIDYSQFQMPDYAQQNPNYASNASKVKDDSSSMARATSSAGKYIVDLARAYTKSSNPYNNAYTYGGWDCSKFTQTVAGKAGAKIPRNSSAQYAYFKQKRALYGIKQARAGDIIFMRSSSSPSGWHVGIYIGKGQMIDNSGRGRPIKVRSISGRTVLGFGRLSGVKLPKASQPKVDSSGRVAGTQILL